jgi:DNA (cytosine-5)-methyltransferase 1
MNEPSLTLLTSPVQRQTQRCHPVENRPLQILEYARIQSFADNYRFSGTTKQIFEQIGNAVPVNLAKAVAREIKVVLS